MSSSVKTTRIEKKYKDKKTGEWKSITIDYAKVADRLKEFREANPRSKTSTQYKILEDGTVIFKAYVWKDKTDFIDILKVSGAEAAMLSADSDGTAKSNDEGEKSFEKLETIAIGRALALLGYAGTGEIASSEEMERYEEWKLKTVEDAVESIKTATKRDEFEHIISSLTPEQQKQVTPVIKQRMAELKEVQHAS